MNELTIRFLNIYKYFLETKKVSNPTDFAKKIGVSTSLINEILKSRTNVGINPIQNIINNFPEINSNWLLTGTGEMILQNIAPIDYRIQAILKLNKEDQERILETIDALISHTKTKK